MRPSNLIALLIPLSTLTISTSQASGPAELLERLPAAGVRFATQQYVSADDNSRFIIAQVDRRGLTVLTEEKHSDYHSLYWADPRTLVGGFIKDTDVHLQRYVDGKRTGPPQVIPRASWDAGEHEPWFLEILVEKKNQNAKVFIGACFEQAEYPDEPCKQYRAMPLDPQTGALGKLLKKRPANTELSNDLQRGTPANKLPKLKAPAGYTVKLHKTAILDGSAMMGDGRKVPALTCKGPDGSATWPSASVTNWEFMTRPKAVRWVSHEPPLFVATGPSTNPIGQTEQSMVSFRGCSAQALEGAIFAPHHVWFESRAELAGVVVTGNHWVVHVGPHVLGHVPGDMLFVVAPE